jgi:hypothetical protein
MVSDTDLARGAAVEATEERVRVRRKILRRKRTWSGNRPTKFLVLMVSNLIFWAVVYYLWTADGGSRVRVFRTSDEGLVTGILHNRENPSAVVCGQVVGEGEIARGYKVIKIHKDKVELEKEGKRFTTSVK